MMREIKFRGRGAPRGKQWFYGDLDTHTSGVCILDNDTLHTVVSDTVGQYTGLLDTAQKEIYEGDIVVVKEDGKESRHIVRYMDDEDYPAFDLVPESMSWCGECNGLSYCMIHMDAAIYVIGNIHDNPELLRLTKK